MIVYYRNCRKKGNNLAKLRPRMSHGTMLSPHQQVRTLIFVQNDRRHFPCCRYGRATRQDIRAITIMKTTRRSRRVRVRHSSFHRRIRAELLKKMSATVELAPFRYKTSENTTLSICNKKKIKIPL